MCVENHLKLRQKSNKSFPNSRRRGGESGQEWARVGQSGPEWDGVGGWGWLGAESPRVALRCVPLR